MLRTDGKYIIYVLQHWGRRYGRSTGPKEWVNSSLDYFALGDTVRKEFGSSGQCWQNTGIHGTLHAGVADMGVHEIARMNPGYKFRAAKVTISQKTEGVMTCP